MFSGHSECMKTVFGKFLKAHTHRVPLNEDLPCLTLQGTEHSSKVLAPCALDQKDEEKGVLKTSCQHVLTQLPSELPPNDPSAKPRVSCPALPPKGPVKTPANPQTQHSRPCTDVHCTLSGIKAMHSAISSILLEHLSTPGGSGLFKNGFKIKFY